MRILLTRKYIVEKEMVYALKKLGHNAGFIDLSKPLPNLKKVDLLISTPWSHYPLKKINKMKKKGIKVAYWSRATPNLEEKKFQRYIDSADHVFTCYKSDYNYLPLCASNNPMWSMDHDYKWDVCSVIRHSKTHARLEKLKEIFKVMKRKYIILGINWHHYPSFNGKKLDNYNQRYKYYWNSKMAINILKSEDALPLRYFESIRCKCFPIFFDTPLLKDFFPEELLITFDMETKPSKILKVIDYYLNVSNKKDYRKITSSLYKIVMKEHTFVNRMKELIKVVS